MRSKCEVNAKQKGNSEMKSNTYKHAWIPTDEMVPENPGKYLVSARRMKGEKFESMILDYGSPVNEKAAKFFPDRVFPNGCAFGEKYSFSCYVEEMNNIHEVNAWMPLPEPYKEWRATAEK